MTPVRHRCLTSLARGVRAQNRDRIASSPAFAGRENYPSASRRPIRRSSVAWSGERSAAEGPLWATWPRSEDERVLRQRQSEFDMLLDQDEGAGAFLGHAGDGRPRARRRRWAPSLPAARRAASSAGLVIKARAIASICCSPPDDLIAVVPLTFGQSREEDRVDGGEVPAASESGHGEVLLDRERREDLAAFLPAAQPMPASARRCGGCRVTSLAAPADVAAADARIAHDGEQQRRLANAVAPQHCEPAGVFRERRRDTPSSTTAEPSARADVVEMQAARISKKEPSAARAVLQSVPWPRMRTERTCRIVQRSRGGGSLADERIPADHHNDARGETEHQLEYQYLMKRTVMSLREPGDGGGGSDFLAFFPRDARRRFVKQQHLGPGCRRGALW